MECPVAKADSQRAAEFIRSELLVVPDHLLHMVSESGVRWYSLPSDDRYRFHAIYQSPAARSHYALDTRRVCLIDELERDHGFSTVLHEFAHALDHVLDWASMRMTFRGEPLDWYAALNPRERFAQAFEAYHRDEREPTPWYAVHTRLDLRRQEPDLYAFLDGLHGRH